MYQKILTFILIFLAAAMQVSMAPGLFFGLVTPDIVLVLIIIWASRQSFESFWLWALVAGLILDILSLERIGIDAISFLLISVSVAFFSERFFVRRRNGAFLWVAFFLLVGTLLNYFLLGAAEALNDGSGASIFSPHVLIFKILNNLIILAIIYRAVISLRDVFPIEDNRLLVK